MTDKFPMHSDFPMDEAYKAKAAERGFAGEKAQWLFEEWREYWTGRRSEEKTPRGWLQCWDNNLKRKARNGAGKEPRPGRFYRDAPSDVLLPDADITRRWVRGIAYTWTDVLKLKAELRAGREISKADHAAIEAWKR